MDVDIDRDDGSVLDVYLVSCSSICYPNHSHIELVIGNLRPVCPLQGFRYKARCDNAYRACTHLEIRTWVFEIAVFSLPPLQ